MESVRNLLIYFVLFGLPAVVDAEPMKTIGWIEQVRLLPENFDVQAKIDTGADNSSLDVNHWEVFDRNGQEWLRFEIYNNNGESKILERPLEGYAKIKRKGTEPLKRPVVTMQLCVGDKIYPAPVNMASRAKFKYRMLIGRSFLKERFLVDSDKILTLMPECGLLE